ncbi:putative damage-inducible protein DinB [Peribacillus deserti]|uniref:Damage-inducible protein DinB n=1 Tax=Peribacillus deserti TaxID=673318 RepID=A0ABS2QI53_9BACI|nr:DinB family protein [Peribacillus deserti]MBM7692814.1 putative damage-inducible protein DinB [Peribacillus deserti]
METNKRFREELLNSVGTLTDEQINLQIEEGRWTIAQILEHLYLMETSITKAIVEVLGSGESQPAEDKPIHLAVNRAHRVEAPIFVTPSDDYKTLHELTEKLTSSRQLLISIVNTAEEDQLKQKSYPHPVFGRLSLFQWIPFVGYHEKRHLEQIEELKAKLIN